jgi:hypothetical protein
MDGTGGRFWLILVYINLMSIQGLQLGVSCGSVGSSCPDQLGCPSNVCPDFVIKRHDTKPSFKVAVEDCDGALDLTDDNLVVEVNMWAKAKLKRAITEEDYYFSLADNIGFNQIMVGDIIIMDRPRLPEHMLVTGFDETNSFVSVERGYNATTPSSWSKGQCMRIFRVMNGVAEVELLRQDVRKVDGTLERDKLVESFLVYEWDANATCLPGCYWLEFKLLKMQLLESVGYNEVITPSFTPSTMSAVDFGCTLGAGVEWVRRFPVNSDGFLIKVVDTSTSDL